LRSQLIRPCHCDLAGRGIYIRARLVVLVAVGSGEVFILLPGVPSDPRRDSYLVFGRRTGLVGFWSQVDDARRAPVRALALGQAVWLQL